ncbi:DUF1254 domain-containing protein [Hyphomicrobium sp. D-2]|uniref:DUF1254 domain-containing protein n=1 Tax=Hyphomicrobium sp. D-2 TaxID=3041621 RepID=UPI002457E126|nr:DUF1254 domain-containing protein [Hyphomicrobium sp. D-2]MDH4981199.1 DUF1254 domain-containing protein [Hyphomicrobium sp. D-2]
MTRTNAFKATLLSTCAMGLMPAAAIALESGGATPLAVPSAEVTPPDSFVEAIARTAYIWGWPMVNVLNRYTSITKAERPELVGGILPVAPRGQIAMLHDYLAADQRFIACPNQDVVYGLGYFDLDAQPVVVQVPDFGDRFWIYAAYDQRTDQFGHFGKQYGTKPGFYLLVGPNWNGTAPEGISGVMRSSTKVASIVPRVFMNDTEDDRKAIQSVIDQIVVYPLDKFDGKMKTVAWNKLPVVDDTEKKSGTGKSGGEVSWVDPDKYFDQLGTVLQDVPPLPGEEALYAQFRWLLALADKDPSIKKLLRKTAVESEKELIAPFFKWKYNGKPAGNNWNRSLNNAQWGVDYYDRTGTARSNILENRPTETQYFFTDRDANGKQLNSTKQYTITFKETPPVDGFWSLSIYDKNHLFSPNKLHRHSLGTKNADLKLNDDGSLTLHVSAKQPKDAPESNWLPAPDGDFSLYIRAYWGKEPIIDGSWQPPEIAATK